VPFEADVTITYPRGAVIVGKFYQSRDGSTRLETGPEGESPRVIHIKSVALQRGFIYHDGEWSSNEFKVGVLRPRPWYRDQVQPYGWRLALRQGESGSITATAGFSAYRWLVGDSSVYLLVPELNLFPVVRQRLDGRREVYSNIHIGDAPTDLFRLPSDVRLRERPISAAK
jgi:hypothetical protein